MQMSLKTFFIIYAVINFATFVRYGVDKWKAKHDRWRIKESTLLLMGLLFGAQGQLVGMRLFHHKTQKWYFVLSAVVFMVVQFYAMYLMIANGLIK